jgi:hypothetical protein
VSGDGSNGFVLTGIHARDRSGSTVSGAGDVNADGIDDVIISATNVEPGEFYVVFGRDTAQAGNFPAVFPLSSLTSSGGGDGSAGFVLNGGSPDAEGSATAAGDLNDDGVDDVVIGRFRADPGGVREAGQTFVVFGRTE